MRGAAPPEHAMTTSRTPTWKPSHWARNAWIALISAMVVLAAIGSATTPRGTEPGRSLPPELASGQPGEVSAEPSSAPPAVSLLKLQGDGMLTSEPFAASGDSVDVHYEFECTEAAGFDLNFYGTYETPLLPDVLVSEFATEGSGTTTESLNGAPGPFTIEIVSGCSWSIEVLGAP